MSVEKRLTAAQPHIIASSRKPGLLSGLLARRARKEQAAFEALIDGCWDALWRYAHHLTGNSDDAEDLLSESLVEGFRCFAQFRGETPFVRWMYRVMTTTHIDMARRASRRRTESLDALPEESREACITRLHGGSEADPAAIIVGGMLSEPIQRALSALPEEFRAVVVLADIEQMDYADVSRVLLIPVGTVRSRLHRARALLRKSLALYVDKL